VAGVEVDQAEARSFGVIGRDEHSHIIDWVEKPKEPPTVPGKPDKSLVSMGVYIFNTDILVKNVIADAKNSSSSHDFGKDVVPQMIRKHRVFVHTFTEANNPESRYWRDIGTLDAYWEANMDLCSVASQCNLYDPKWPIRTYQEQVPPARIVNSANNTGRDKGKCSVVDSLLSGGCIVSGGKVARSVLSHNVEIGAGALVEDSVLLDGVRVGDGARIRKAIVDNEVVVPNGFSIGRDLKSDRTRFSISPGGVVVVPRGISLG